MFGQNKELNQAIAAEQRQMNFQREHTATKMAGQDDYAYLAAEQSRADLMRWQQDLIDEVEEFIHTLKSEELVESGWKRKQLTVYDNEGNPIVQNMQPLMNDVGIQMIKSTIKPLLSRNLMNSNFTDKDIRMMLHMTSDTVTDNICDNYDIYQVDFLNFDIIDRMVVNIIRPAPFRAMNDGERKHQRTMNKRIESFSEHTPGEEKKSALRQMMGG